MNDFEPREDPELARRLDATFAGIRPRPGFQDELLSRLRAGVPWWRRLSSPGLIPPVAWPAMGGLAVVVVALLVLMPMLGPRVSTLSAQQGLLAPAPTASIVPAQPSFGRLPVPALRAPTPTSVSAASAPADAGVHVPGEAVPYYGPADLVVTVPVPEPPTMLNVFRWVEPTPAELVEAQRKYGGTVISGQAAGREPLIALTKGSGARGTAPDDDAAREDSDQFLEALGLMPDWSPRIQSGVDRGLAEVSYIRKFVLDPSGAIALQIDREGDPAGAVVRIGGRGSGGGRGTAATRHHPHVLQRPGIERGHPRGERGPPVDLRHPRPGPAHPARPRQRRVHGGAEWADRLFRARLSVHRRLRGQWDQVPEEGSGTRHRPLTARSPLPSTGRWPGGEPVIRRTRSH
jgi:hypothetical protein